MKFSTFMSIAGVVAFIFGVAFMLIPKQTLSAYGVALDTAGEYITRYWGSAFIGIACITWFARFANPKSQGTRAIILGGFILCVTGFVVALFDTFYGVTNNLIWSTVVIYFLLGVGFGYYQFRNP